MHVQVQVVGGCISSPTMYLVPHRYRADRQRLLIGTLLLSLLQVAVVIGVGGLWAGVFGAVLVAGILFATVVRSAAPAPVDWILARSGARPIRAIDSPFLSDVMRELSRRAGINTPQLYLLPQREPNAMALGSREHGAVAVTPAILRMMNRRELAGVLAHEISHLRSDDSRLLGLAQAAARMTSGLSRIAVWITILSLPLLLFGVVTMPGSTLLLIIAAPVLSTFLALALSRTREYLADLEAVALTGDPVGLASALQKLERSNRSWVEILLGVRPQRGPDHWRSHPNTDERVERLLAMDKRVVRA